MKTEYIYYLHEGDNIPKYVGHTNNPDRRLGEHIAEAMHGITTSMKCVWIRTVLNDGGKVEMRVVDECPADQLGDLEYYWINEIEGQGYWLYNGNSGVRGEAINEAALRDDVQQWKRSKRKRNSQRKTTARPPTADELADAERLFREDPIRFRLIVEAKREIEKQNARQ